MLNFLDVYERTLKGPIMSEQDFDMKVFIPTLRRIVKTYEIKYDKQNPVPADNTAADNLFDAALDFLSQVGVYCQDTNRIIQFTKDEILEAVREAPGKCFVGEGKDTGVFEMRKPDDGKRPWLHVGSGIVATTEEMMTNLIEAYGSIAEGRLDQHLSLRQNPWHTRNGWFSCRTLRRHPGSQDRANSPPTSRASWAADHEPDLYRRISSDNHCRQRPPVWPASHRWLAGRRHFRDED